MGHLLQAKVNMSPWECFFCGILFELVNRSRHYKVFSSHMVGRTALHQGMGQSLSVKCPLVRLRLHVSLSSDAAYIFMLHERVLVTKLNTPFHACRKIAGYQGKNLDNCSPKIRCLPIILQSSSLVWHPQETKKHQTLWPLVAQAKLIPRWESSKYTYWIM